jgi:hypothetical protein
VWDGGQAVQHRDASNGTIEVLRYAKPACADMTKNGAPRVDTASEQLAPVVRINVTLKIGHMALKRMDNVGIVVDDLEATIDFFRELGLDLEGRATIGREWAGRVTGRTIL